MKYLLPIFLMIFSLYSCETDEETETPEAPEKLENNFKISGQVTDGQNLKFYLEAQSDKGPIQVAETTSDGTGKFEMVGNIPGYGIYQLRMGETPEKVIPLTLVPEDNVKIRASYGSFITPTVTGTKWADAMTNYMQVYQNFVEQKKLLELNRDNLSNEEINRRYLVLRDSVDQFSIRQMDNDPANPFNFILIASAMPENENFNTWDEKNLNRLKRVEHSLMDQFPKSPLVENLSYQVFQLEQKYNEYLQYNAGIVAAPEIALPTPDGRMIRLSDLKGQYVLIDFWASWCAPCRRENPNVVRLYNKYKDKGFTVFSVSLDEKVEDWKAAIAKDGLAWPNHCSDLQGWNSSVIPSYGFTGIPFTVLLNPEGKYIGVMLRGEELEQKLKEIFEK